VIHSECKLSLLLKIDEEDVIIDSLFPVLVMDH